MIHVVLVYLQGDHGGQTLHFVYFSLEIQQSCPSYAISANFAVAQTELGRQWNNQIEVNKAKSLTTMVNL